MRILTAIMVVASLGFASFTMAEAPQVLPHDCRDDPRLTLLQQSLQQKRLLREVIGQLSKNADIRLERLDRQIIDLKKQIKSVRREIGHRDCWWPYPAMPKRREKLI